jgi:hypothetical protein
MLSFGALEGGRSTLECLAEHVKNMMETGAGSPRP